MVTTAQTLVDLTRNRYLLSGANEQRNKLTANYSPGGTTLAFQYDLRGIVAGCTLGIGQNVFYVWSVDGPSKTATVQGGYRGATDVLANSGDIVTVNPRWSDFEIFQALNEELVALSAPGVGLYQMKQSEFAYNSSRVGFDLAGVTDVQQIHSVRYAESDSFQRTPSIPNSMYRLERNYLTSENSSTVSLKLFQGAQPGRNITVLYKAPFLPFAALTDNVTVTGLPSSAYDLPPLGAALRLGVGREVRRNDTTVQGDTRRAEEVGPGSSAASWRGIAALRQQRINEEVSALTARYPDRL
jgi:hypothetical protein